MSIEDKFVFIGWKKEGTSDKIWGYFLRPTPEGEVHERLVLLPGGVGYKKELWYHNACRFWGRRGGSMRFKADVTGYELAAVRDTKLKEGYVQISAERLIEIWPTFIEEAESKLMWEVLAGRVK